MADVAVTTTEDIKDVRRAKEDAVEVQDWVELARLRDVEKDLLVKQAHEFKPNSRGS